ncbi:PAP/OAS1 substrate-binding domain superfamily [Euphorbia peplus]|nr:PAP/OAS1 substrate-binding domain superfamily [Euphorbia peplus]
MGSLQKSSSSSSSPPSSDSLNAYPFSIDSELWHVAEERIQEILCIIQPASASEKKRKEVIDHVRMLIQGYYTIEVIPFGSVPLKTYLPDGDIDLTALSEPNKEEELAREVCNILKYRETDPYSEVTDVRYIDAQVKVVKCCVKDIPIDISFNQIPGLCTLCFLEKVDRLIGKNHLLKHSIILIKAWCFYESRILGAFHGLISTYALEILVLHIINIFHLSLPGPLAVLHRFLEYYSTFDWKNYCVGINGPVALSSLRGTAAESQDNTTSGLLLPPEFLRSCREEFSVPVKAIENGGHEFPLKHLNILDPLKYDNNLGRSVSKGNFHRIKCALNYGAQRLGEILTQQGMRMGERLEEFFKNTLDRNGKGERPDTPVPVPAFGTGNSPSSDISGDYDSYYNSLMQSQWYMNMCSPPLSPQISPPLSPTDFQLRDNWQNVSMFVQFEQNTYPQIGTTNVYVSTLAPSYPCVSQPYATTIGVEQLGKSRGTGTYIPNVRSRPYRDLLSRMRQRSLIPRYYTPFYPSQTIREIEPEEIKKQENSCHDLTLDQFPLLPSHNKATPPHNGQTIFQSFQTNGYPTSINSTEFGFTAVPPPLSVALPEPDSVLLVAPEIPEPDSVLPVTPEIPESDSALPVTPEIPESESASSGTASPNQQE